MTTTNPQIEFVRSQERCYEYRVYFLGVQINTLVTPDPACLRQWISQFWGSTLQHDRSNRTRRFRVTLKISWFYNPQTQVPGMNLMPATINFSYPTSYPLCPLHSCIIFQLHEALCWSREAFYHIRQEFLLHPLVEFVGINMHEQVNRLFRFYYLRTGRSFDLFHWASNRYLHNPDIRQPRANFEDLVRIELAISYTRPAYIIRSNWAGFHLHHLQAMFAAADCYLMYLLAHVMRPQLLCLFPGVINFSSLVKFSRYMYIFCCKSFNWLAIHAGYDMMSQ